MIQWFTKNRRLVTVLASGTLLFLLIVTASGIFSDEQYRGAGTDPTDTVKTDAFGWRSILHYDSEHYVFIADHGYDVEWRVAFFPLYPLLARVISAVTQSGTYTALMIISWASAIALSVALYYWIQLELQRLKTPKRKQIAIKTIVMIALFPTSFFLACAYTESLFMLLTVLSLICYRKQKYWLSGIFAALTTATRVTGVILIVFYAVEYFTTPKSQRSHKGLIPLALAPVGLLAFMAYQALAFGSPLTFLTAQQHWFRFYGDPILSLVRTTSIEFLAVYYPFFFAALYATYRTLGASYAAMSVTPFMLSVTSGSMVSFNRYLLVAFPLFLGAIIFYSPKLPRIVKIIIGVASFALLLLNIFCFYNLIWVA